MQHTQPASAGFYIHQDAVEANAPTVSWGAVAAGAVIATAVSAMLLMGGAGFGFLFISPWHHESVSEASLTTGSILWMLATQIIASGTGGYVAGRLRTKWIDAEVDEIYFRDTAHGFLVWALSALGGLALVGAMAAFAVSGNLRTAAPAAGTHPSSTSAGQAKALPLDYFADVLLRPANQATAQAQHAARPEVLRMLDHSLAVGRISEADRPHLIKLISQHARVDAAAAEQRLLQIEYQARLAEHRAREASDSARKMAMTFSLWALISLLVGAFTASFAAPIGGRTYDPWIDIELEEEEEEGEEDTPPNAPSPTA